MSDAVTRTVTVPVRWLALAAVLLLVVLGALAVRRPVEPAPPVIDPAAVRRVCETYAGLDLAELAPLCVTAGYQQTVAPEDLGR